MPVACRVQQIPSKIAKALVIHEYLDNAFLERACTVAQQQTRAKRYSTFEGRSATCGLNVVTRFARNSDSISGRSEGTVQLVSPRWCPQFTRVSLGEICSSTPSGTPQPSSANKPPAWVCQRVHSQRFIKGGTHTQAGPQPWARCPIGASWKPHPDHSV